MSEPRLGGPHAAAGNGGASDDDPRDAEARDADLRHDAVRDETPDPIEHGTPDVELAEAQLAVGRGRSAEEPSETELEAEAVAAGRTGRRGRVAAETLPAPRGASMGARLVHFAEGSWRELQRVQWPDRRQVFQATGVVIGFVIVAGVFLGVADLVASKVVTWILK